MAARAARRIFVCSKEVPIFACRIHRCRPVYMLLKSGYELKPGDHDIPPGLRRNPRALPFQKARNGEKTKKKREKKNKKRGKREKKKRKAKKKRKKEGRKTAKKKLASKIRGKTVPEAVIDSPTVEARKIPFGSRGAATIGVTYWLAARRESA